MRAEAVTAPIAFHGEGPVWSLAWGGLRFVDLMAGDVLTLRPDGTVDRRHVGTRACAMRPRAGGGAVLALEDHFVVEDPDGTLHELSPVVAPGLRFNDGACDPQGRFYCGTMAYDQTDGVAGLHRLDPDGTVQVAVLSGLTISNGLEWAPDGSSAYFVDTPLRRIDVCSPDLSERRPFVDVDGFPDGLTVDAEGGVWVALYGGAAIHRYAPNGALDAVIDVPTARPTACTFGGDDLATLFITTTQEGGGDELAGALCAITPGVPGLPARTFAG